MTRIGPYTLHTIETGRFGLDGGAMFGIVPRPLWARRIAPDEQNRIPLHMRCLLLEGDGRLVLIDDGMGEKYDDKFRDLFAVNQEVHDLHGSLRAAGFAAEEVTDVVLTHLHFDHCGGSTYRAGAALRLTFPNAVHHVQRDHWVWANAPNPRERNSFLAENLEPLAASGRVQLHDGPGPLFPGVETLLVNGHTEAQQLVKISDADRTLLFAADLLPTHAHLAPAWGMGYDVRPLVTIDEKAAVLETAHREGWHLFFEHDPTVVVASLEATARGYTTRDPRPLAEL